MAAGLSLAGLADGKISRAALHLIETGQSRTTLPTLRHIAARTGKPISHFLSPGQDALISASEGGLSTGFDVAPVEELIARLDYPGALEEATRLLDSGPPPDARARLLLAQGIAHLHLGHPEAAHSPLTEARGHFLASGDRWAAVDALDWMAAASQHTQSDGAYAQAEAALEECERLDPVPPQLLARILARLGGIHGSAHRWKDSIRAYEAAIDAAGSMRDLPRVAKIYGDLGNAYAMLNDLDRAGRYATKALAIYEALQSRAAVAQMQNNLAEVLLREGDLGDARRHLERSLQICEEMGIEYGRANVLMTMSSLEVQEGRIQQAVECLDRAIELTSRLGEMDSLARAHELRGGIAHRAGDSARADSEFRSALHVLQGSGTAQRLMEIHTAYATVLEERGDTAGALEQWRLAVGATNPELLTGRADAAGGGIRIAE